MCLMAVHSQLQQFQMAAALNTVETGCGDSNQAAMLFQQMVEPFVVFSEPRSVLTCNLSGSRKRAREELLGLPTSSSAILYQQQRQFLMQKQQALLTTQTTADVPVESSRIIKSAMTSTSGWPPLAASASATEMSTVSPAYNSNGNIVSGVVSSSPGLLFMLHCQNIEVENLLHLHEQKLRLGVEEVSKHQCTALVSAIEEDAKRRISEKQAELAAAAKRSAEIEDRLREVTAESHAWFNVAKNSEALIAGLRDSLEQTLLQNLSCGNNNGNCADGLDLPGSVTEEVEGYGDSEEDAGAATAILSSVLCPEASSTAIGVAERSDASAAGGCCLRCKSCDERNACVLLLPCRHLCLCPSCENSVNDCPICGDRKNTALQISLS